MYLNINFICFSIRLTVGFTIIKTSLGSIATNQKTIDKVQEIVKNSNLLLYDLHMFIRLYLIYQFDNGNDLFLDRNIILGIFNSITKSSSSGRPFSDKELIKLTNNIYNKYCKIVNHKKINRTKYSHIFSYLIETININITNNIVMHFSKHLRNYIKFYCYKNNINIHKKYIGKAMRLIYSGQIDWKNKDLFFVNSIVKHITSNIIDIKITEDKHIGYLIKVYPYKFLSYMIKMSKEIEMYNDSIKYNRKEKNIFDDIGLITIKFKRKKFKMYQCIPIKRSLIPNYIPIDTSIIKDLLEDNKKPSERKKRSKKGYRVKQYSKLNDTTKALLWNKHFGGLFCRKFMKKNFDYLLSTDGVGVSLYYKTKKKPTTKSVFPKTDIEATKLTKRTINKINKMNIVGLDPGKNNIISMIDGNNKKFRYTSIQRRFECHFKLNMNKNQKLRNNNKKIKSMERILSKENLKTTNINNLLFTMQIRYKFRDYLENFYTRKVFRRMKFDTYIFTQKSEAKLVNNIKRVYGKNICICYGNYSGNHLKGCIPSIGIGMKEKLSKYFRIVTIDEYKTSKTCHSCKKENEYIIKRKHPNRKKSGTKYVHGLLRCKNVNCSKYWDRDVNGAKNIREIFLSCLNKKERPKAFRRPRLLPTISSIFHRNKLGND